MSTYRDILIGNICCILAMLADSFSSTRKTRKNIMLAQCLSCLFYFAAGIVLKGYSAAVQNAVGIIRNLVAIPEKSYKWLEYLLIALAFGLGVYFNNLGWLGLLPVIGNLEYSIAVFRFKNDQRKLKIAFAINMLLFAIFDIFIYNFVGCISSTVVFITTIIALIKDKQKPDQKNNQNN